MIKTSLEIYNRYLIKIMMSSLLIVIPLSLFLYFATYYLYDVLAQDQYPSMYTLYFILLNFICIIPMYRRLAESDLEDEEEPTLLDLMKEFIKHFGIVLCISIPLYIVAMIGMPIGFIPTVICGVLLLLFPFTIHYLNAKKIMQSIGSILKKENIFVLFDLLVVICSQVLVYSLLLQAFDQFESNFYVYGITKAIVNACIFPFLIFYLTQRYRLNS
ncbi:hypothetical protein ACFOZ1_09430 [Gracilibacillus marinus]|jgi:hypothetical protein|uniref:Uncharacterized protein n=1 Tax=Gracilibacillus marinus TaxID=630535 RepID=A0ABV8VU75_9BACI